MADNFVAEIRVVGFTFAPKGWALCNGQLLAISQNTALFSLLGTQYGGDGKSTFALPNIQSRVVMAPGNGPGLTPREVGEEAGSASVTLLQSEIPAHSHFVQGATDPADVSAPASDRVLARSGPGFAYRGTASNLVSTAPTTLGFTGGSQPHNNYGPVLVLNYIIALQGIFPARP